MNATPAPMVPSPERVEEILSMRSTDSRRGDMDALAAYIHHLRAQLAERRGVVPELTASDIETFSLLPNGVPWQSLVRRAYKLASSRAALATNQTKETPC